MQGRGSKHAQLRELETLLQSPLMQGRGSKLLFRAGDFDCVASPLVQGRGSKLQSGLRQHGHISGRPSCRGVDRNPCQDISVAGKGAVAPRAGAWNRRHRGTDRRLATRPTKKSDTRSKSFGSTISVELDAIEPNQLRALVQEAIERHLPPEQFEILKAVGKIAQKRLR